MGIAVFQDVATNISKGYNRVSMKEMDYLKWRELKTWEALIVALLGCVPFGVLFYLGAGPYNFSLNRRFPF